jgi:hypothetical protein
LIKLFIYEDDVELREGLGQFLTCTGEFLIKGMFDNCDNIQRILTQLAIRSLQTTASDWFTGFRFRLGVTQTFYGDMA